MVDVAETQDQRLVFFVDDEIREIEKYGDGGRGGAENGLCHFHMLLLSPQFCWALEARFCSSGSGR